MDGVNGRRKETGLGQVAVSYKRTKGSSGKLERTDSRACRCCCRRHDETRRTRQGNGDAKREARVEPAVATLTVDPRPEVGSARGRRWVMQGRRIGSERASFTCVHAEAELQMSQRKSAEPTEEREPRLPGKMLSHTSSSHPVRRNRDGGVGGVQKARPHHGATHADPLLERQRPSRTPVLPQRSRKGPAPRD